VPKLMLSALPSRQKQQPENTGTRSPGLVRWVSAAVINSVLTLTACSAGSNAVDQSGASQFRYVGITTRGSVIPVAQRRLSGDVRQQLITGGDFRLSDLRGKVVVLNFWASWCGPCKTESPHLQAVYQRQKAHGVSFVGIDIKDEKQAALAFIHDFGVTYPIVYDEPARSALQIGNVPTRGLPTTVVIDKVGRVAAIYTGALFEADIEPVVVKLAAER
jgi:thiol-disulfide isomerase/thioredoxin